MDKLSQLDELAESDILDALGENKKEIQAISSQEKNTLNNDEKNESNNIRFDSTLSKDDLSELLHQLLENKTLEITVKIKD